MPIISNTNAKDGIEQSFMHLLSKSTPPGHTIYFWRNSINRGYIGELQVAMEKETDRGYDFWSRDENCPIPTECGLIIGGPYILTKDWLEKKFNSNWMEFIESTMRLLTRTEI